MFVRQCLVSKISRTGGGYDSVLYQLVGTAVNLASFITAYHIFINLLILSVSLFCIYIIYRVQSLRVVNSRGRNSTPSDLSQSEYDQNQPLSEPISAQTPLLNDNKHNQTLKDLPLRNDEGKCMGFENTKQIYHRNPSLSCSNGNAHTTTSPPPPYAKTQ